MRCLLWIGVGLPRYIDISKYSSIIMIQEASIWWHVYGSVYVDTLGYVKWLGETNIWITTTLTLFISKLQHHTESFDTSHEFDDFVPPSYESILWMATFHTSFVWERQHWHELAYCQTKLCHLSLSLTHIQQLMMCIYNALVYYAYMLCIWNVVMDDLWWPISWILHESLYLSCSWSVATFNPLIL